MSSNRNQQVAQTKSTKDDETNVGTEDDAPSRDRIRRRSRTQRKVTQFIKVSPGIINAMESSQTAVNQLPDRPLLKMDEFESINHKESEKQEPAKTSKIPKPISKMRSEPNLAKLLLNLKEHESHKNELRKGGSKTPPSTPTKSRIPRLQLKPSKPVSSPSSSRKSQIKSPKTSSSPKWKY